MRKKVLWRLARSALVSFLLLTEVTLAAPFSPRPQRNVLVLFQDAPIIPFTVELANGLHRTLQQGDGVSVYVEYLDLSRLPHRGFNGELRAWLHSKYTQIRPDVIVAVTPGAVAFATGPDPMWPGVPIVFCAVDERVASDFVGLPGVTGVTHHSPIRETMELAIRLLPRTRKLALIGGAAPEDMPWEQLMRADAARLAGRVEVIDLFGLPMGELLKRLAGLPSGTPIMGVSFYRDGDGHPWSGPEVLRVLEPSAPGPIFSIHEFLVGRGLVGGETLDWDAIGAQAGNLALRIINGERAVADGFETTSATRVVLDGRILRRWKIPDRLLPPGSTVRFRAPFPWEEYPRTTMAIGLALVLQGLLIVGMLFERRRRLVAQHIAADSQAAIAHMNRVSAVSELAGALAHEINTPLASILNNARAARRLLALQAAPIDTDVAESLLAIESEGERAGEVIRRVRGVLRRETPQAGPLDLREVVREAVALVEPQAHRLDVTIQVELSPSLPAVDGDRVQILQVILNLLLNAMEAVADLPPDERRVFARTDSDEAGVRITVADNGKGFAADVRERLFEPFFTTKPTGLGMGLSISRSIVERHRGRIWVDESPGGGVIHVRFPAGNAQPKSEGAR